MAVEWGRRPYSTVARFHTGPDAPLVKIKWFVTTKPFQKFPSAINSLDWEEDWTYRRVLGEQPTRDRKYNGLWSVPGLVGDHQCGERDQFVTGVPWPVTESSPLDPDGIPLCCDRAMVGQAKAGASAGSTFQVFNTVSGTAYAGALAAGLLGSVPRLVSQLVAGACGAGTLSSATPFVTGADAGALPAGQMLLVQELAPLADAGDTAGVNAAGELEVVEGDVEYVEEVEGGIEFGGEFSEVYVPGDATPGTDCASAATILTGHTYSYTISVLFVSHWFKYVPPASGIMHVEGTGFGGMGANLSVYSGGGCPFPTPVMFNVIGPPCWEFPVIAGQTLWLKVDSGSAPVSYSFVLDTGAC